MSETDDGIEQFTAAPNGWRVALGHRGEHDITVLPLIGWAVIRAGEERSDTRAVEPVIMFDNVGEPLISTVASTIASEPKDWFLHQILPPGTEVVKVPDGFRVRLYGTH
jgi:hypothetical protein